MFVMYNKTIVMRILIYTILATVVGSSADHGSELKYLLAKMNKELLRIYSLGTKLEWESATNPSRDIFSLKKKFSLMQNNWKNNMCSRLNHYRDAPMPDVRMIYLLCRGPIYTSDQVGALESVSDNLSMSYATRMVCRIENEERKCYHGEPDLEKLMAASRNESELLWAWTSWRNEMSIVKELFMRSIDIQNSGARNNGYHNIGECWREELEIPNLEDFMENLYGEVEHLYRLLHAVVRFRLAQKYPDVVKEDRPIPAHLLGDLWSHNWEALIDLILPKSQNFLNITDAMLRKNYTIESMVKHAEDYYVSLGFPALSREFWARSVLVSNNSNGANCHATAANMFEKNDYRIMGCFGINAHDFYVIHHEIGHIQYYMAYEQQPTIFQNGVNSAFHEAIGDSIMLGVMTSQHLERLGLAEDVILTDDLSILLYQALAKLPQLPYAFLVDKWRWRIMANEKLASSRLWWELHERFMGIEPPSFRKNDFFDPAANFHIVANTPYTRYFIANVLQYQLFDGMCEAAVTGKIGDPKFFMELHRCDIYGSKKAAKKLRSLMSRGSSVDWRDWIREVTGKTKISAESLLRYYKPVKKWLENEIRRHRIPVGWKQA